MLTKEEIEEIRAQLPDEWKPLLDGDTNSEGFKLMLTNGKLDIEKVKGYIEQIEWFNHIGF
jgi:hypothetical protein